MGEFVERKIGEGRTAEIIQISETEVLKLFFPGYEPAFIRHEFDVTGQVARYCGFAPETYSMDIRGDRTGIRFEFIEGIPFTGLFRSDPGSVKDLGSSYGVLHRDIHSRQWGKLPEGTQVFGRIIKETKLIKESDKPLFLNLAWDRSRETLCHGDFHPYNVLYEIAPGKKEGFRVVDWTNAYIGHPLSDVARTVFLLSRASVPRRSGLGAYALLLPYIRNRLLKGYLDAYFGAAPVPWELLAGWGVLVRIMRLEEHVPGEAPMLRSGIKRLIRKFKLGKTIHKDAR